MWPIATNTPFSGTSVMTPVSRCLTTIEVTSPWPVSLISWTSLFNIHAIFGFARALSTMIFEARNVSRRWTTVTLVANFVRKVASSMAESPPPTTAIS